MSRVFARGFVFVLGLGTLSLAGCFRGPDPLDLDDEAPAVHAILETGADSVVIAVSRPSPTGDGFVQFSGISGAEVRLIAGSDTTWLLETPDIACVDVWYGGSDEDDGAGCYRAMLDAPIQPGADYQLHILLPDGTTITGETTTPQPVDIVSPEPREQIVVDCPDTDRCYGQNLDVPPYTQPVATIRLEWAAPPTVRLTSAVLRPDAIYLAGTAYPGNACGVGSWAGRGGLHTYPETVSNILWVIPTIGCRSHEEWPELQEARFDSIRAEFSVIGWNETASRYIESSGGRGIRVEAASQGLEGAYGVFGAVSRATREVTLVRSPPPATTGSAP